MVAIWQAGTAAHMRMTAGTAMVFAEFVLQHVCTIFHNWHVCQHSEPYRCESTLACAPSTFVRVAQPY